jgi:hypothetical protein
MPDQATRRVRPPVTAAMLAPLEPGCRRVQLGGPLSDGELARLAEIMGPRPEVSLSLDFCHGDDGIRDLDLLRFFPWLERLTVWSSLVGDLSGLACLTGLQHLHIDSGRRPRSAAQIAAVAGTLRHLHLEGPVSDAGALSELTGLRTLTLRSVTMPDLSPLTPMTDLRALDLKLNGTKNLTLLPAFTRLQYF